MAGTAPEKAAFGGADIRQRPRPEAMGEDAAGKRSPPEDGDGGRQSGVVDHGDRHGLILG